MPANSIVEQAKSLPMFFILGRPRSGTTLFRTLFDAHPNVSIPPECTFVMDLRTDYGKTKYWTQKKLLRFLEDLKKTRRFLTWGINEEELKHNLLACEGENSYATLCKVVYLSSPDRFAKQQILWVGDKNPGYILFTKKLVKLFPGAKYFHLVRDARDQIVSVRKFDFEERFASVLSSRWNRSARIVARQKKRHPGKFCFIRYEDLVSDSPVYFKQMCDFLEIDYHEDVFSFYKRAPEFLENNEYKKGFLKYHTSLLEPINKSKIGDWRGKLSDKDIKSIEAVSGKWMKQFGYELVNPKPTIATRLRVFPGVLYEHCFQSFAYCLGFLPYAWRSRIFRMIVKIVRWIMPARKLTP